MTLQILSWMVAFLPKPPLGVISFLTLKNVDAEKTPLEALFVHLHTLFKLCFRVQQSPLCLQLPVTWFTQTHKWVLNNSSQI
jgi:hypothetical protein